MAITKIGQEVTGIRLPDPSAHAAWTKVKESLKDAQDHPSYAKQVIPRAATSGLVGSGLGYALTRRSKHFNPKAAIVGATLGGIEGMVRGSNAYRDRLRRKQEALDYLNFVRAVNNGSVKTAGLVSLFRGKAVGASNYLQQAMQAKKEGKMDLARSLYAKHKQPAVKHDWGINQVPTGQSADGFGRMGRDMRGLQGA